MTNVPEVATKTTDQSWREDALWTLANIHMEGYWRGCTQGNFGRAAGFCVSCDCFTIILGPDWANRAAEKGNSQP